VHAAVWEGYVYGCAQGNARLAEVRAWLATYPTVPSGTTIAPIDDMEMHIVQRLRAMVGER
jgi:hypothetical protein